MAKFSHWRNPTEIARDLKRGLYQLTFKDNMPEEPKTYTYAPEIRSPSGTTFNEHSAGVGLDQYEYTLIGSRCFLKLRFFLDIAGADCNTFWIKLPAPADRLAAARSLGLLFTSGEPIFVDCLVGYPTQEWIRCVSLSETAALWNYPIGNNQDFELSCDYNVSRTWLRTGTLEITDSPFIGGLVPPVPVVPPPDPPAETAWTDFSSTANPVKYGGGNPLTSATVNYASVFRPLDAYDRETDIATVCISLDITTAAAAGNSGVLVTLPFTVKNFGSSKDLIVSCGVNSSPNLIDEMGRVELIPNTTECRFRALDGGNVLDLPTSNNLYFSTSFTCPVEA